VIIAVDANLLIRLVVADDAEQARIAADELDRADRVVLPLVALCEFAWVLRRGYGLSKPEIANELRALTEVPTAIFDRSAVESGLELLRAGGDFADGVIAHQGRAYGADTLVTFDRDAVQKLTALGGTARLPHDRF